MKKILLRAFGAMLILTACSNETVNEEINPNMNSNEAVIEQGENYEDEYIKTAIESSLELQESADELFLLFESMEVTDSTWKINVDRYALQAQMAANNYTLQADLLNEDQSKKYESTQNYYGEGVEQFHVIYSEIEDALETYDKKKFQEIQPQLSSAIDFINKGIEQLEIDRYQ